MKQEPARTANRVDAADIDWQVAASYPEALRNVVRWKTLIGSTLSGLPVGVPHSDVKMGVLDLDPGGYYPAHAHPAPEIYYVLSGTAEWTVGADTFAAAPGMAIYHAPDTPHRMVNRGTEPLKTVWFWWAPDGRTEVLGQEVTILEEMPASSR